MRPILLIDNFDSFTHNIAHGLIAAGATVDVRRCDQIDLAAIETLAPGLIVLSPGPGRPEDARLCLEVVGRLDGRVPIVGICLGMQVLAVAFGGAVGRAPEPVHGKVSPVHHNGLGVFDGIASPIEAGRYHSLCVTRVPPDMEVTARTAEGIVMGMRHRSLPIAGVQFHPDSFLTEQGGPILKNMADGRL